MSKEGSDFCLIYWGIRKTRINFGRSSSFFSSSGTWSPNGGFQLYWHGVFG